jgi:hypothetical protein
MRTPCHSRIPFLATILLGSSALTGCTEDPSESAEIGDVEEALSSSRCPDDVPAALAPGKKQRLWFVLRGDGVQIYTCTATASGHEWLFKAPEAELLNRGGAVVGTHYAGPTWEHDDGSTVVAASIASAPSPKPNAIPWLLLRAVSHSGHGKMTNVTAIQRLATTGGTAPTSRCDAANVGDEARVPYTADYFFYRTGHGNPHGNPRCGD